MTVNIVEFWLWLHHVIQPIMVPLCFVIAWGVTLLLFLNLWSLGQEGIQVTQRLHQIPCSNCRFFTGDYHLKCTVNPKSALTEAAIDCPDYRS
jgi:hypothetical protein